MTALTEETAREMIDKIDALLASIKTKGGGAPRVRVPAPEGLADKIKAVMIDSPVEMSRRDLTRRFGGRVSAAEIESAVQDLVGDGWLYTRNVNRPNGGPTTVMVGYDGLHNEPSE